MATLAIIGFAQNASAEVIPNGSTTTYRFQKENDFWLTRRPGVYFEGAVTMNSVQECGTNEVDCISRPFANGDCVFGTALPIASAGPADVTIDLVFSTTGARRGHYLSDVANEKLFKIRVEYTQQVDGRPKIFTEEDFHHLREVNIYDTGPALITGDRNFGFSSFGLASMRFRGAQELRFKTEFDNMTISICDIAGGITAFRGIEVVVRHTDM
ncbi:hypothetical protein [Sorangium sp. So ce1389]|uniref:hypothetical protein n=1 Tax=Sorangium sp. So ce1389 TaxID=3133336 RepID=UPI003F60A08E